MVDTDDHSSWDRRPRSERQAQKQAVEAAELHAQMFGPDEDLVSKDAVSAFVASALSKSRFDLPEPVVAVDLDRHDVLTEVLEPGATEALIDGQLRLDGLTRDGVIHLHPERLSKWTSLHELAHYIVPRESHGPIWCGVYVELVRDVFGTAIGDELLSALEGEGAELPKKH